MARNLICALILITLGACSPKNTKENDKKNEVALTKEITDYYLIDTSFTDLENTIGIKKLGNINRGAILEDDFYVKNGTDQSIVILNVNGFCGCLSFKYDKKPLKSGEIRKITYIFDTKQKRGPQLSTIKLETNINSYSVRFESNIK